MNSIRVLFFIIICTSQSYGQFKTTVKYVSDLFADTHLTVPVEVLNLGDTVMIKSFYPKTNAFFVERRDTSGYVYFENVNMTFDALLLMDDTKAAANKGSYWIGMSMQEATRNLETPDKIQVTAGSWGKTESWYFKKKNLFLHFENSILTSYSEDK